MMNLRNTTRFFTLLTVLEVAVVALVIALAYAFSSPAEAHTLRPTKCDLIWQQAPPGQKWEAKQRCLAFVYRHNCAGHPFSAPRSVKVKGVRADRNQRHVIGWIVSESERRPAVTPKIALAAIAATTQEASARELPYGDGSSLGPFQLISDHGTPEQRISVEFSGNWFFNGAIKSDYPGLSINDLAQAVEASGHPYAYQQWVPEARRTYAAALAVCRHR